MKAMSLRDSDPPKPPTVGKSQPLQDQEFAERLRIAEIWAALREAAFSCELSDGPAQTLKS